MLNRFKVDLWENQFKRKKERKKKKEKEKDSLQVMIAPLDEISLHSPRKRQCKLDIKCESWEYGQWKCRVAVL